MNANDPATFNHQYSQVNGIKIHYVDESHSSEKALLLIHGWPDLWCGWREQIPFLVNLGYRVIAPTLRGFGETDVPAEPSSYTDKAICGDFAALLDHLQIPTVTVIGHDWGGLAAWRFAQFYPERTVAVASFCTPYLLPDQLKGTLEDIVKVIPSFRYQLHLASPVAEQEINENPEAFFKRMLRPITEATSMMDKTTGMLVRGRPEIAKSDKIPQKVLDYYVAMCEKAGAGGGLKMYKRYKYNYEASKDLDPVIRKPAMMVTSELDPALPPSMANGIEKYIPNIEVHNVRGAGHWVLWEQPAVCNELLEKWLSKVYPVKSKM
ncbi:Alpha/Beta hydrolase protein [Fennellomyces sp. T-0311]|nr:Alpha/Beta hydrolase protein [Fennellomyces sp. T-0311]